MWNSGTAEQRNSKILIYTHPRTGEVIETAVPLFQCSTCGMFFQKKSARKIWKSERILLQILVVKKYNFPLVSH